MYKLKYKEPIITRIKLDPEQAILAQCSTASAGHIIGGICRLVGAAWGRNPDTCGSTCTVKDTADKYNNRDDSTAGS